MSIVTSLIDVRIDLRVGQNVGQSRQYLKIHNKINCLETSSESTLWLKLLSAPKCQEARE
jgi:hypothetical protein